MSGLTMVGLKHELVRYGIIYLKEPPKVVIQDESDPEEAMLGYGQVCVVYGEEEHKTIARTTKLPAFSIGTMRYIPGNYDTPPEEDYEEITTATNLYTAAAKIIALHLELELYARMESDGEYEAYRQQQLLDKQIREEGL